MTKQPRGILLDASDTLFTTTVDRLERFRRFLRGERHVAYRRRLREVMTAADREFNWPEIPHVRTRDEESTIWTAYCQQVLGETISRITPDLVVRAMRYCTYLNYVTLYPDTLPALEWWLGHVRLGLISNAEPSFAEALERLGLPSVFDDIVLSSHVGLRKPDLAIYQHALANLDLAEEETWFIDDRSENVVGALRVGLRGYGLGRNGTLGTGKSLATMPTLTVLINVCLPAQNRLHHRCGEDARYRRD